MFAVRVQKLLNISTLHDSRRCFFRASSVPRTDSADLENTTGLTVKGDRTRYHFVGSDYDKEVPKRRIPRKHIKQPVVYNINDLINKMKTVRDKVKAQSDLSGFSRFHSPLPDIEEGLEEVQKAGRQLDPTCAQSLRQLSRYLHEQPKSAKVPYPLDPIYKMEANGVEESTKFISTHTDASDDALSLAETWQWKDAAFQPRSAADNHGYRDWRHAIDDFLMAYFPKAEQGRGFETPGHWQAPSFKYLDAFDLRQGTVHWTALSEGMLVVRMNGPFSTDQHGYRVVVIDFKLSRCSTQFIPFEYDNEELQAKRDFEKNVKQTDPSLDESARFKIFLKARFSDYLDAMQSSHPYARLSNLLQQYRDNNVDQLLVDAIENNTTPNGVRQQPYVLSGVAPDVRVWYVDPNLEPSQYNKENNVAQDMITMGFRIEHFEGGEYYDDGLGTKGILRPCRGNELHNPEETIRRLYPEAIKKIQAMDLHKDNAFDDVEPQIRQDPMVLGETTTSDSLTSDSLTSDSTSSESVVTPEVPAISIFHPDWTDGLTMIPKERFLDVAAPSLERSEREILFVSERDEHPDGDKPFHSVSANHSFVISGPWLAALKSVRWPKSHLGMPFEGVVDCYAYKEKKKPKIDISPKLDVHEPATLFPNRSDANIPAKSNPYKQNLSVVPQDIAKEIRVCIQPVLDEYQASTNQGLDQDESSLWPTKYPNHLNHDLQY